MVISGLRSRRSCSGERVRELSFSKLSLFDGGGFVVLEGDGPVLVSGDVVDGAVADLR